MNYKKTIKKLFAAFLVLLTVNMPCFAVNWVTITAENGKSGDLDIDSIKMAVDTVEYDIKVIQNEFTYVNRFSTELYKEGSPTALISSKKYKNEVEVSSETYKDRNYRELKPGTLQAEIFDVLSKDLSEKTFNKGQKTWDKYLKKQRKAIQSQWKPRRFKDYNSYYVSTYKNEPVYSNQVELDVAKDGTIVKRSADDYTSQLYEVRKLDPLPTEYTAETFKLNVDMKCYKYAGSKIYNKGEKVSKLEPTSSNLKISKNSKPPVLGHMQFGLLRAVKGANGLAEKSVNHMTSGDPLVGLLELPVVLGTITLAIATDISCGLMFMIVGGDFEDL